MPSCSDSRAFDLVSFGQFSSTQLLRATSNQTIDKSSAVPDQSVPHQLSLPMNCMLRGPPTPKCESKLPSSAVAVIVVLKSGDGSAKFG